MNKFSVKGKVKVVNGSILTPEYAGLRLILNFVNTEAKTDSPMHDLLDKKWRKINRESWIIYWNTICKSWEMFKKKYYDDNIMKNKKEIKLRLR